MTEDLSPFRRQHGDLLQVHSRKGKTIAIPCPRCRHRTPARYWHTGEQQGVCDRCWRELEAPRIPAALQ